MLAIYSSRRAGPALSGWLQQLLGPLKESLKFQRLPPLEIRPTGKWSGICEGRQFVPDGRVCISSRISYFSTERIVQVYIHEAAHRLMENSRHVYAHGPEFFCLNMVLLLRAAPCFKLDVVVQQLSLYDLHDQPEGLVDEANWRGIVVDWALAQARDLAASAMAAEDLPAVICALWLAHLQARLNESQQAAQQALLAALTAVQRVAQIKALKSSRSLFAWLGGVGWVVLFGVSVVFVNL